MLCAGGDKAEVGICHNVFWTEPAKGGPFYAHVRLAPLLPAPIFHMLT